jgi:hypothetical protein
MGYRNMKTMLPILLVMLTGCNDNRDKPPVTTNRSTVVIQSSLTAEDRQRAETKRQERAAQIEIPVESGNETIAHLSLVNKPLEIKPEIYVHQKPVNGLKSVTQNGSGMETIAHDGHYFVFASKHAGGVALIHHPSCPCLIVPNEPNREK